MDALEALRNFYEAYDEQERFSSRHGSVEFLTTVRYVERYLFSGARILEIGAGTGRYSHYFARKGYEVDAVELIDRNIGAFREHTQKGEPVSIRQGNATDLFWIDDEQYDIVLLLGPMYHLFTKEEQLAALSESIRVARRGGVVFAAYCMADASILGYGFGRGHIKELLEKKMLNPETFETYSAPEDVFELYTKEKIDGLMAGFTVDRLHFLGSDMAARYMSDVVDAMDNDTFQIYLRYHFSICERPDLVGATHHSLDVFRKR